MNRIQQIKQKIKKKTENTQRIRNTTKANRAASENIFFYI